MSKAAKKPKPYRATAIGILNPYGDIWTPRTFRSEQEAREHLETFWCFDKSVNLKRYRTVPVRLTVSALPPKRTRLAGGHS